jgi:uncharacterized protein YacL
MFQAFVQFPPELQALIGVLVTFVISFLLVQIANVIPWLSEYLGQYKQQIIVWLTGLIVSLIQGWLNLIPAQWEPVAILVGQLIVAVFAVLGFFKFLANRGVRSLR